MLRVFASLLLVLSLLPNALARDTFYALRNAVHEAVREQHEATIFAASEQLARQQLGLSYELYVRPSIRVRTGTDSLPRVRTGANVGIAPDPIAVARAHLAIARAEFAQWQARVRGVEAELLLHLDAYVAEQAVHIAEHQVRTQQENLRQLETSDDYDPALVTAAEIAVRAAVRDAAATHETALRLQDALHTPGQTVFDLADVFGWRFAHHAPPLLEHPQLAILHAQAAVTERTLRDAQFRPLHKIEGVVTWEDGPLSATGAVRAQRTTLGAHVGGEYDTLGTQSRVTLEVSGDFRFDQHTSSRIRASEDEHQAALAAIDAFLATQPTVIAGALRTLERAEEALDDALLTLHLAEDALAHAPEREAVRRQNEVDRAHTALHRAWRQYLRAVRDYLEASGGVYQLR